MTKQVAESQFRESFKSMFPEGYILKLQVNQLAHQTMPADYFIQVGRYDWMVECKQVKI